MKLTDQQLEQAAKQVAKAMGSAPFSEAEKTFSSAFEEKMARMLKKQHRRKNLRVFARSAAAVLLVVIMLCGTVLTFDAEARTEALYHWQRLSHRTGNYQFDGVDVQTPLAEYAVTAKDCSRTINASEGKYCLQMYERGETVFFLKYCRMVASENFSISIPYWDRESSSHTVAINGMEGHLYRSSTAVRPSTLVWMDTESGIAFILFGTLASDDLIALAESVQPIKE